MAVTSRASQEAFDAQNPAYRRASHFSSSPFSFFCAFGLKAGGSLAVSMGW
jgi:hypothetical protein